MDSTFFFLFSLGVLRMLLVGLCFADVLYDYDHILGFFLYARMGIGIIELMT